MALADRAELAVRLTLDDRQFTGGLRRAQSTLGNFSKNAGRVGKGIGQIGAGFARIGYTAAAAAAGGLALVTRESIAWESALAGVNKTMDLTPEQLQSIGTEIRTLATQIPVGANAIAGLVEQAGALGIAQQDVVEFARVAATIGVTTPVAADQAAEALGALSNLLGLTGKDYERFASALVDLGNKGASSEDAIIAITNRAAGAGATIGLTTQEILGFSSAVANLKIEPEAAASSLQKFFIETLKSIREGGAELDVFAETAGVSADAFAKMFQKAPADALETFIDGLAELGKGKRLDVLEDLGFSDIRITRMLLGLAEAEKNNDNLTKSLNTSELAWRANTAAAEEADKRYGTVGSKIDLLKNQAIESALLIGEGFLPALGRMADKLKLILSDPAQRQVLKDFGKDIGSIIDGIDFNKVIAGAKTMLEVVKGIWGILKLVPVEVHATVLGLAGLNKLSGGLLGAGAGNIIGGIGGAFASSLTKAGIGKFFVQPVFVTNPGFGGLGGAAGAAGAAGKVGSGPLALLGKGFAVLAVAELASEFGDEIFGFADQLGRDIRAQLGISIPEIKLSELEWPFGPKNTPTILPEIFGGNGLLGGEAGPKVIPNTPFGQGMVAPSPQQQAISAGVKTMVASLAVIKANTRNLQPLPQNISAKQKAQFDALRNRTEANRIALVTTSQREQAKLDAVKVGQNLMKAALATKIEASKQTSVANASRIIGAIRTFVPVVNTFVSVSGYSNPTVKTGTTVKRTTSAGGNFGNKQIPVD